MIKTKIINDAVMYVNSKESESRTDYYFNRKAYDNKERGHVVIENGKPVCERQAPALEIVMFQGSHSLKISGQSAIPINTEFRCSG